MSNKHDGADHIARAQKNKYPHGYPNDEPGSLEPTFRCQECKKKFPKGTADGTECANPECSHQKCAECPRVRARKVRDVRETDPDVMAQVAQNLRNMNLLDPQPTTTT